MSKQIAEIRSGATGQSPVRFVVAGDLAPRIVQDWREVLALWAAHERGDLDSAHERISFSSGSLSSERSIRAGCAS